MIYPNISKTPEYRVSIPTLDGGLNTADGVSFVEDNQLTECKNFWWKDGALRTRPGVVSKDVAQLLLNNFPFERALNGIERFTSDTIYLPDGRIVRFTAFVAEERDRYDYSVVYQRYIYTVMQDADGTTKCPTELCFEAQIGLPLSVTFFSGKPTVGMGIYMMVGYEYSGDIYELKEDQSNTSSWGKLNHEDYYTPLVIINGKGNRYASLPSSESAAYAPASTLEGFNMLNNVFSASFTADNVSWAFDLPDMEYVSDIPVEVTYTNYEGREYKFIASAYDSETGISKSARQWVNMLVSDHDHPRYYPEGYSDSYPWEESEPWKEKDGYTGETIRAQDVKIHMQIDWFFKKINFVRTVAYPNIDMFQIPGRMGRGPANNIYVKAPRHSNHSKFIRESFASNGSISQFNLSTHPLSNLPGDNNIIIEQYFDWEDDLENKLKIQWIIMAGQTTTNVGYVTKNIEVEPGTYKLNRSKVTDYTIMADRSNAAVSFYKDGTAYCPPNTTGGDNIVISAYTVGTEASVYRMNKAVWFGGQAGGLTKGSRLFVTGDPVKPNLVYWSDLNNPLYFPENSYAYIGDAAQPVTAFGKQSEMLVFFKPNEIYYTTYVEGESYSAEDVLAGKVVDIASQSAVFPVYQIHPTIGCDCPDTLQLCDNRLVWVHSSGKVCALTSASPSSERNVSVVSRMIERELKQCDLQRACSADWQGHYVLFADRLEKNFTDTTVSIDKVPSAFLMDYSSPGFQITVSGGEYQDPRPVKWYVWELPVSGEGIVCDGVKLSGRNIRRMEDSDLYYSNYGYFYMSWAFIEKLYENDKTEGKALDFERKTEQAVLFEGIDYFYEDLLGYEPGTAYHNVTRLEKYSGYPLIAYACRNIEYIDSRLRTKLFDFGKPERIKNVTSVFSDIGCNRDYRVSFMSERGETPELKYGGLFSDKGSTEPGYLQCVKIIPSAPRVRRFGIGVSTSGAAAFSGLSLKYKVMGV